MFKCWPQKITIIFSLFFAAGFFLVYPFIIRSYEPADILEATLEEYGNTVTKLTLLKVNSLLKEHGLFNPNYNRLSLVSGPGGFPNLIVEKSLPLDQTIEFIDNVNMMSENDFLEPEPISLREFRQTAFQGILNEYGLEIERRLIEKMNDILSKAELDSFPQFILHDKPEDDGLPYLILQYQEP